MSMGTSLIRSVQINPLTMQTAAQHSNAADPNEAMMPTEIIVSGPNWASRLRATDKCNTLMTPDPVF